VWSCAERRAEDDVNALDARGQRIEGLLRERLEPVHLVLEDESYQHRGHAGAKDGGSHYRAVIVSPRFEGKTLVEQHRLVHDALAGMFGKEIHALALKTVPASKWTPPA
jgi:BolA protein